MPSAGRIVVSALIACVTVAAKAETALPARKDPPPQFDAVPDVQFDETPKMARPPKGRAGGPPGAAFPKTLPPLPEEPRSAKGEWKITPSVKTGPPPGSPSGPGYGPRLLPPK